MPSPISSATGLAITNPLILYRALLSTKVIDPDPAQHRLALQLQKLYFRLKDYSPQTEYGTRLQAIRAVEKPPNVKEEHSVAVPGHPLRRNPLFAHLFSRKEERDTLALTRVLTSHEAAMSLDSPKGLLLHGEVGTGKSMLVDLLADSLPNRKKRRWHFNTFMLETLARLEHLRRFRSQPGMSEEKAEHSLVWLAKDMIEKSPILFLDEFQLPDRASSKILSNLFTAFFQLGGVLIATSNRMPDELAKASGSDFAGPSRGGIVKKFLGFASGRGMSMFPANNDYAAFVEVLKARCEIWNLEGGRDWRRKEAEDMDSGAAEIVHEEMIGDLTNFQESMIGKLPSDQEQCLDETAQGSKVGNLKESLESTTVKGVIPKNYFLAPSASKEIWQTAIKALLPTGSSEDVPWQSTTLLVYGRTIPVQYYKHSRVTYWSFQELCGGTFGSADYITLASTFHTLILDKVPVLTLSQKNEARRLITLLDALYEARCKLLIRANSGPDDLFFPETKETAAPSTFPSRSENEDSDAVYPETLSEIHQDQTSPFRPNVSAYTEQSRSGYDPDEDSDFGTIPGSGKEHGRHVDFGMTSSFTGEDERFAYKRARSRLWEMCGARWHARSEPGWWRPLPLELRRWERSSSSPVSSHGAEPLSSAKGDVKLGESVELDRPAGLQGKHIEVMETGVPLSYFREQREPPAKMG